MGLSKKLKNFIFSKKFLINFGILVVTYILVFFLVSLYLSKFTDHGEKIGVPNLVNKNVSQINSIIGQLGLTYEVSETVYEPSKPEGTVLSQDPMPTEWSKVSVKEGRIIRVKVSKKTQLVEMPNCVDKSQRFAESILKSSGIKFKISYTPSVESAGAVIQQLYKGNQIDEKEKIPIGSTVTLIVGKGALGETVLMPNLIGLTICDVKSRLSTDLNVRIVMICDGCVTSADSCSAKVFSQSPEYNEGATLSSGSTITIHANK